MPSRYRDTMYYSDGEIDKINNHISKFIESKNFFEERQLNYKTGILLYGEPGSGKSTIAKVIATTYNRSIISVNMAAVDKIDFGTLAMLINNDVGYQYIVLLEDIDTLYNLNRNTEEVNGVNINVNHTTSENEKKVINKLLQFLDSNQSPNNVIFIATTNHIDKLDPAILREGRFDLKVEVKGLTKHDAIKFVESFGIDKAGAMEVINKYEKEKSASDRYNQSALQAMALAAKK
jgi:chaperone BCS1